MARAFGACCLPPQKTMTLATPLQRTVHFRFVDKNRPANSFAQTKIVTCIRKLWLLFVKMVVYIQFALHIKDMPSCVYRKDKMKQSYRRPFFVCSERENPCKFWQWGDIFESPRPLCLHCMVCCERKAKKDGPNQNRLFYCCPRVDPCNFFA